MCTEKNPRSRKAWTRGTMLECTPPSKRQGLWHTGGRDDRADPALPGPDRGSNVLEARASARPPAPPPTTPSAPNTACATSWCHSASTPPRSSPRIAPAPRRHNAVGRLSPLETDRRARCLDPRDARRGARRPRQEVRAGAFADGSGVTVLRSRLSDGRLLPRARSRDGGSRTTSALMSASARARGRRAYRRHHREGWGVVQHRGRKACRYGGTVCFCKPGHRRLEGHTPLRTCFPCEHPRRRWSSS